MARWVPAGMVTLARPPSMVGTSMLPPSAAVAIGIGTRQWMLAPSRWNRRCGLTDEENIEIAVGRAAHAGLALAGQADAGAVLDAGGMVTARVFLLAHAARSRRRRGRDP